MYRCDDKYVIQEVSTNRDWLYLTGQLGYTTFSKEEKTRMKLRYVVFKSGMPLGVRKMKGTHQSEM